VGVGCTKCTYDTRQYAVISPAHVYRGAGKPHGIDTDHVRTAVLQLARSAAACTGQLTTMLIAPLRNSMVICACLSWPLWLLSGRPFPGKGKGKGMNAGSLRLLLGGCPAKQWRPLRSCSLSQRCSTLAFMPCESANAAVDAPSCLQAATSWALNSGV
jgi:hypothetical protein